jgi:tyrosinase
MANTYSRRSIIRSGAALAAIPFSLWFEKYAKADPPMVRYSLSSPKGAAMLATYTSAVATMNSKGEEDACSWNSQWYTHAVPDTTSKAAELASLTKATAAQINLATEMWDTCAPHHGQPEDYFLPWHRMFVYFFERIVRKTSGDPTFTLPYWNYTDPMERALPAQFRQPANTGNPLYRIQRDSNGGMPIDYATSNPATSPVNLDDMKEADYPSFNNLLDHRLHGTVHTLVGNTHGMGYVPDACGDPVFWMHHCNIDRIWASWNKAGGTNPTTSSWLKQQFIFADENCNRVAATVSDFNSIDQLAYTYDYFLGQRLIKIPLVEYEICILKLIRIPPDPGPLRVEIPFTRDSGSLRETIGALKANEHVMLTVQNLEASAPVGSVFELFLGAPANRKRVARGTPSVGAINFFDAVPMKGMEHATKGNSVRFDITNQIQALNRRGALIKGVPLAIQAMGKVNEKARATLGEIRISIRR